ncbi:hypothetical protein A2368_02440 [Candidatus Collierbacteria bacterium RIFOXYB1_FULL_49_13]|uniref:Methyltransferase domain-containing protein n=1 Tax=Candidatus Collierbacteria bacterium RIFOXYB1_FULL_49_13 TaxID=1817728 RepID=A0A1F5FBC0_9BACT|nr:MAG: hypothetical protein A2368_02440 [Candidatus Collierbacteria bacterium RIFOXYB1_FULL_49_13]
MQDSFTGEHRASRRTDRKDFEESLHRDLLDDLMGVAAEKGYDTKGEMQEAKVVWDLGAGAGTGSVVLAELCPEAEIWAVDPHQEVVTEVKKLERFHQSKEPMQEFVRKHPKNADVIYMASLKNPELRPDDYQALFDALEPGGIVIETGDTKLNKEEMAKRFRKPIVDWVGTMSTANRIWMKI